MGIKETVSQIGLKLPEGLGNAGGLLQSLAILIIVGFVVGIIAFYVAKRKQFNKKIHIFEEVNGQTVPVGLDHAKEIILPNTSIRAFYLRKKKYFLPRPSIQVGVGHYWFFIRDDGEWMNVRLENLNTKLKQLGIHYDHTDMRMANASLKKLIEKNYKKLNWIKEFAPYIAIGVLVIFLGLSMFLGSYNTNKAVSSLSSTADTNKEVAVSLNNILANTDRICAGSGIREVG